MTEETPETGDPVAAFAADLRALRLQAECPTLARLEHETGVSKSVLSSALSGKHLPSSRTVDRLARALGAESAPWVRRRDALAASGASHRIAPAPVTAPGLERRADAAAPAVPHPADAAASAPGAAHPAGRPSRLRSMLALALAFLMGVLVAGTVSWGVTSSAVAQARDDGAVAARRSLTEAPASPHAQISVSNGANPALTPCVNDATVATSSERAGSTRLEILWSDKCYAGWARVTRYDQQVSGNSMTVAIYPEQAALGPDRQTATEPNMQSAYTTLVVRPTQETRLCAAGSITLDGASIDLGEPLCI